MRIIGIDPGTGRCGYALLEYSQNEPSILTYGVIELAKALSIPQRLVIIEATIGKLLDQYQPTHMAIETLLFNRNITTAMQVSECRGVIMLIGAKRGLVTQDCTPLQVKMNITGYGRADKAQMKLMLQRQLKLSETHKLDDALDALGIAITGYHLVQRKKP